MLVLVAVVSLLVVLRLRSLSSRVEEGATSRRLLRRALPLDDPVRRRLFWGAEAVFAVCYALGALLASLAPDVWNTEKPMDMAFITAINASDHFPPHDPWMSGETLNYYYFGHVVFAWPIKLLGLAPDAGYLLSLGRCCWRSRRPPCTRSPARCGRRRGTTLGERAPRGGPVFAGLVAAALVAILGNLAGVRTWVNAADPPRDYAWFEPSRVIPDTINEFPSFSFLLGDLHAHVLALPFTVLALAFALQVALVRAARRPAVARGGGGARRRARASARCTRSTRGRTRWPRACWPPRVVTWIARRRPARLPARLARPRAGRELRPDRALRARLRPGGARDRGRARAPAVRQVARRHGADLRDPRSGRCCAALAGRLAAARAHGGAGWGGGSTALVVAGSLLASEDLTGALLVAVADGGRDRARRSHRP